MYVNRTYRDKISGGDLVSFRVVVQETDLYISVSRDSYSQELAQRVERLIIAWRHDLDAYIEIDPAFKTALEPHMLAPQAPPMAVTMAMAAGAAGVGPMAAVAGAFAEYIGFELLKICPDVIVENGGDIFMSSTQTRLAAVFAGTSPFSNRIAVEVQPDQTPLGICTSSGTVGPSLSFGKADAAVILAPSAALADAAASRAGNVVQKAADLKKGIEAARKIAGVSGALLIKDDQMAVWGQCKVVPILG